MNSKTIHSSIHRNIKIEKLDDKVNLIFPFFFESNNKLIITIKLKEAKRYPEFVHKYRAKGFTVNETNAPTYSISDNGCAINELKSKINSFDKYIEKINNICHSYGFSLSGERIINKEYTGESVYEHDYELSLLIDVISQISNLDLFFCEV